MSAEQALQLSTSVKFTNVEFQQGLLKTDHAEIHIYLLLPVTSPSNNGFQ